MADSWHSAPGLPAQARRKSRINGCGSFTLTPALSLRELTGVCIAHTVIPAKAGIQGMGASFDKLRACPGLDPGTNELSIYIPL